ncbi:MAG: RNA methyltransferase [Acidimicrobiales bacterium]
MRRDEGAFVIEGPKLLAEALAAGLSITEAFVADEVMADHGTSASATRAVVADVGAAGIPIWTMFGDALASAVDVVTPQPVAAIAEIPSPLALAALEEIDFVVALAGVANPGNAGTLVRSAEAARVGAVLFGDGSVDPFAPKCVRASAGSIFRVPWVEGVAIVAALEQLREDGHVVAHTRAGAPTMYDSLDYTGPVTFVLGNEAHGVAEEVAAVATHVVSIPMAGQVESLNVAVAGAVLCFEAARQRRAAGAR